MKALIEPSQNSPLEPAYALRACSTGACWATPYWFTLSPIRPAPTTHHWAATPTALDAFYTEDSGGILFDFPYTPSQFVTLLGPCKSVMGSAAITVPDRSIVPEEEYDEFLARPPIPITPTIGTWS